ncbi:MAG: Ig-like domain-containing protein, partial [Chthoniobacteraceae bacterium]
GGDSFTFKTNDGKLDSPAATVSLAVAAVNDAPTFTPGGSLSVSQDDGAQTRAAWATSLSAGPADEAAQTLHFVVVTDHPELFATVPAIDSTGTLTFAPASTGSGTASVLVTLHDSGGTALSGVDASAPVTFQIAVTSNAEETGTFNGLAFAAPATTPANASAGLLKVTVAKKGVFTGSLTVAGTKFPLRGHFDKSGVATFGVKDLPSLALPRKGQSTLSLTLQLDVGSGTDKLSGVIADGASAFALIDADRARYTSAKSPVAPLMHPPAALPGRYTVALNCEAPLLSSSAYPQGDGVGVITVAANGTARFAGTLADGTVISSSNAISKNQTWPLYAPFAHGQGSLSGFVTFRDVALVSDADSSSLQWFKPADDKAKYYPAGWPQGLQPALVACKFVIPAAAAHRSVLPGLGDIAPGGNAQVTISAGNLPAPITKTVNVDPDNFVAVTERAADGLVFLLRIIDQRPGSAHKGEPISAVGAMQGSFVHPMMRARAKFKGVILQKQGMGTGFFLGESESGAVTLTPVVR